MLLKNNIKLAFSLAEVLIVLGIIGVVSALTIPNLITKYQNTVFTAKFKKTYSTLTNAYRILKQDNSVETLNYTSNGVSPREVFKYINHSKKELVLLDYYYDHNTKIVSLSNAPIDLNSFCDASQFYVHILTDGTVLNYMNDGFFIDVNGHKSPNKLGRDIFLVGVDIYGNLFPAGTDMSRVSIDEGATYINWSRLSDWKNNSQLCGEKGVKNINNDVSGLGCAARIIEEGWQIKY